MQHLEVSGTPVLYIGRTDLKGKNRNCCMPTNERRQKTTSNMWQNLMTFRLHNL